MPLFTPDIVDYGDIIGLGLWLSGHYYEHQQFITLGLQATPTLEFVDYDIYTFSPEKGLLNDWNEAHSAMHDSLRYTLGSASNLNVDGLSYNELDLNDRDQFFWFMQYHSTEHAQLRQLFGVV